MQLQAFPGTPSSACITTADGEGTISSGDCMTSGNRMHDPSTQSGLRKVPPQLIQPHIEKFLLGRREAHWALSGAGRPRLGGQRRLVLDSSDL